MSIAIILILLLSLVLVIFTLQNTVLISLNFLFWNVEDVSLVLTLLIFLICGIIISILLYVPKIWKLKSKIREQKKQITSLSEKIDDSENRTDNGPDMKITGETTNKIFNE